MQQQADATDLRVLRVGHTHICDEQVRPRVVREKMATNKGVPRVCGAPVGLVVETGYLAAFVMPGGTSAPSTTGFAVNLSFLF